MKIEKQVGIIETCNMSFGNMIKLRNDEEKLEKVILDFLDRRDILLSNLEEKGVISILIKVYSEGVSLVDINDIIIKIQQYLDEEQQVEIANSFEENKELEDYFGLTLIET